MRYIVCRYSAISCRPAARPSPATRPVSPSSRGRRRCASRRAPPSSLRYRVPRSRVLLCRVLQIFPDEAEKHAVDPLVVAPVRLALHALANEARSLGVRERALVEAVDLELEAVEPELEDQVPLQEPCGVVGDAPAAEVRVDGDAAELRDPATSILLREAHHARALAVDLDHEPPVLVGLALRALDLFEDLLPCRRATGREERVDVVVRRQLDEEVDVVGPGTPDRDTHVRAGSTASGARAGRSTPEPSAAPAAAASQPGSSLGAWAIPNGSSTMLAPTVVAIDSVIGSRRSVSRWSSRPASA